jgi:hypothetical protein
LKFLSTRHGIYVEMNHGENEKRTMVMNNELVGKKAKRSLKAFRGKLLRSENF